MPQLIDDIRLSNSMTVEHNTLGPGVIGHILRQRSINKSNYAVTDRSFVYDQVGSVMAAITSTGAITRYYQDSFGNALSSMTSPYWVANVSGYRHNTKESDAGADLAYMYQRWYQPETGTFMSIAPYEPSEELPFSFAGSIPTMNTDSTGEYVDWPWMGPARQAPLDICKNAIHQASKLRSCGATKVIGQFRNLMPWGGGAPITSTSGWTTGLYGPAPTGFLTQPIGGVGAGVGIAVLSGGLIGIAAVGTIYSFTLLEYAEAEESMNNTQDMIWKKCNTQCKAASNTGAAYRLCMLNCGGF